MGKLSDCSWSHSDTLQSTPVYPLVTFPVHADEAGDRVEMHYDFGGVELII